MRDEDQTLKSFLFLSSLETNCSVTKVLISLTQWLSLADIRFSLFSVIKEMKREFNQFHWARIAMLMFSQIAFWNSSFPVVHFRQNNKWNKHGCSFSSVIGVISTSLSTSSSTPKTHGKHPNKSSSRPLAVLIFSFVGTDKWLKRQESNVEYQKEIVDEMKENHESVVRNPPNNSISENDIFISFVFLQWKK